MDRAGLTTWLEAYQRAWRTPGVESLDRLFCPDATYVPSPFSAPIRGLEAIARMWESERQGADEAFAMDSEVLAVDGDTGVARVEVRYGEPRRQTYRDLWVVRLDKAGRCRHFEEWPFWPPGTPGGIAADPG